MRLAPLSFVRRRARLLFATLAVIAIAAGTALAQFGTFNPAFDGELWGVRHELTPGSDATPSGVAFVNGTLFVGDSTNNTVIAYDNAGQVVATPGAQWDAALADSPIAGMTVNQLAAIVVNVDGTDRNALLISDDGSNRAAAFDTDGTYLFTLRFTRPSTEPLLSLSIGELATTGGTKFTLDTATQILSLSGALAVGWTEQISSGSVDSGALVFQGPLTFPFVAGEHQATATGVVNGTENDPAAPAPQRFASVAYDKIGNLYILDAYTERLSVYDSSLTRLFTFGTPVADGTTAEFHEPWGMVFWPDATGTSGRLLVNDTYKSRILVYRPVDGPDADSVIDGLQLESTIAGFVAQDPALELFSIAVDPTSGRIAVTDFAQPRAIVLQKPALAAFDLQVLDASDAVTESVCIDAAYKIRFSLTVPAGLPAVTGVTPRLRIDGVPVGAVPVPGGAYPSTTLSAGDVVTFTYDLTAPAAANADIGVIVDATASNTTDILGRAQVIQVADCSSETDPSTITATPSRAPQVSGWTPVFVGEEYHVTLDAQDDDGIDAIEYQLDGVNETGDQPIETHFDGSQTTAQLPVPLPNFGRTTMKYRVRDGNMIWSSWHSLDVRPRLVVDRSSNENVGVEFRVGDPEGTGFTYSVTGLPAGVTFAAGTGQFGGVVSFDAVKPYVADPILSSGVYPVVITETAPGGATSSVGFTWTINNVNREPIITNQVASGLSINKGALFQMQIVGFDPDDDPAVYTINGRGLNNGQELPETVTIDPVTGLISGVFPQEADNAYRITVGLAECSVQTVTPPCNRPLQGGERLATLLGFELAVLDVNQPADIVNPGPQTNAEGDTVSLHIQASDPDGDLLTFEAGGLPPGLTITRLDSQTALISGTVAWGSVGSYGVTVKADDHVNALKRSVTFAWVVTHTNRPPVIVVSDKTSIEGGPAGGFVSGTDPDNDTLTYTAAGLPPGASMDAHGVFTGSFDYNAAGVYPVTLTISDGTAQTSVSFIWTVQNVNRPPALVTPPLFNAEGDVVTLMLGATDPDGDTLTYSYNGLPMDMSLDTATGRISGTFSYASSGVYTVNIGVSDGQASLLRTFVWTVTETNQPPNVTAIPDRVNTEQDIINVQVIATDADGDAMSYSATNLPTGLTINPVTGAIAGTLPFNSSGIYLVSITVTDSRGGRTTVSFTWTVRKLNRAPTVTAPDRNNAENDTVSYPTTASDPDGDTLSYSAAGLPVGITIDPATGVIGGTLGYTTAGTYHPTITVSDGSLSASATFTWVVTDTNAPPVMTNPGNLVNAEGETIARQIVATDVDPNTTLTFSAVGLPPGLAISASGLVTGTLPYTAAGVYNVTVTVSDGTTSRTATFQWTINNVNRAPDVINPGPQASNEGAVVGLPLTATDPDNDTPLAFSATGLPAGLLINPATGLISGTLGYAVSGTYTVTVTVRDPGGLSDSETFIWTINDVNRPPVAAADASSVTQGQSVVITVLGNDTDPDAGDTLTITSVTQPPSGQGTVTIAADRKSVSYAAPSTFLGVPTFTYTISDGHGGTATATVTVTVLSANQPPVCTAAAASPGSIWPPNHKQVYLSITGVTDPDGGTPTIKFTSILQDESTQTTGDGNTLQDGGIENNGATAWVRAERRGDETAVYYGRVYIVGFTATDSKGASCTGTVYVGVPHDQGEHDAPIPSPGRWNSLTGALVTPPPPVANNDTYSLASGATQVLTVQSDDDLYGATMTIVSAPSKGTATVNANGTITFKAASGQTGTTTFTYRLTNAAGSDTAVVTVTIGSHEGDDNCGDPSHDHGRDNDGKDRDHRRGDHRRCTHEGGGQHDHRSDPDCGNPSHNHKKDYDGHEAAHKRGDHRYCQHR